MENPFQRRDLGAFPHESKSADTIANEVSELEKMAGLEEIDPVKVLKDHGGLESNVPINHPYWRKR
jgi:hypothetical protein